MSENANPEAAPQPPVPPPYGTNVVCLGGQLTLTMGVVNQNNDVLPRRERAFTFTDLKQGSIEQLRVLVDVFRNELLQEFCLPPSPPPPPPDTPPAS